MNNTGSLDIPYKELSFSNDFIFCRVMTEDKELCRDVISACTGLKVGNLTFSENQQSFKITSDGRGIRLDVVADDDINQSFDVEMENKKKSNLPERTIYYMGFMGRRSLKPGDDFSKMRENYVIFIMTFNPYPEIGLHRYTFVSTCKEAPEIVLKDKNTRIFLCADGKDIEPELSDDCRNLLEYIHDGIVRDELTKRIDDAVKRAQKNEEWERDYMELCDKYREFLEEGREIGIEIGREEGREEGRALERKNTEKEKLRADAAEIRIAELEKEIERLKAKSV